MSGDDGTLQVKVNNSTNVTVQVQPVDFIWFVKISLFSETDIPPEKQMLYYGKEQKELENSARIIDFPELKYINKQLILKERNEKKKSRRKEKPIFIKGKKFRELFSPQFSYISGLRVGAVGIESQFNIHFVGKDFQPIYSKESRHFEVVITNTTQNNYPPPLTQYRSRGDCNILNVYWVPEIAGEYIISVRTSDGHPIHTTPMTVFIKEHNNDPKIILEWANIPRWNVIAAEILYHWSSKEEFERIILKNIGPDPLLQLIHAEPCRIIRPYICKTISNLLRKDAFKRAFIVKGIGTLYDLISLNKMTRSPIISQFVSKSFALIGYHIDAVSNKSTNESNSINNIGISQQQIDKKFFETIGDLFNSSRDPETTKNLARAIASFSTNRDFIFLIIEANLFPFLIELFENQEMDISTRRYALVSISNISSETTLQKKLFSEVRILSLIACAENPLTSDPLVIDSIRTLANLSEDNAFSRIISTHSHLSTIIKSISGTDSIANWEIFACADLGGSFTIEQFKEDFQRKFGLDENFNYHSTRLLTNLMISDGVETSAMIEKCDAIEIFVQFINSSHLQLQESACKVIAMLSEYENCRESIIRSGGLEALCSALNTSTINATESIVYSLAQMPLKVKSVLLNIVGETGIQKLIKFFRNSENRNLQKHAAILLSSLIDNDFSYEIISQGGTELIRSLIDLVNSNASIQTIIPPNKIQFESIIGEGISGTVWKATWNNSIVAVKKFGEESLSFSEEEFKREVTLMTTLRHENVAHCLGCCMETSNYYIVSELFERGSIAEIIEKKQVNISMKLVIHVALGIAKGMNYLHRLGVIHRDLKPGNVLIGGDWTPKIIDFGLSRIVDKEMTRGVGTPIYTAPEVLAGRSYSNKADVYSFGFVIWELMMKKTPFEEFPPFEAVIKASKENLRPPLPKNCILGDLLTKCWDGNPDNRPEFDEIINVIIELENFVGKFNPITNEKEKDEKEEDEEELVENYKRATEITEKTLKFSSHRKSLKMGVTPMRLGAIDLKSTAALKGNLRSTKISIGTRASSMETFSSVV